MQNTPLRLALAFATLTLQGAAFAASEVADAMMARDLDTLSSLIAQGGDVDEVQEDGSTALHWAVHWNNAAAVEALLAAGADANASTRLGATPLYLAALSGNAALIGQLLAAGADVNQIVLNDDETALMFAARSGNLDSVKLLLEAGAAPEAQESFHGTTALLWAAEQGHSAVVKLLLEQEVNPNRRSATRLFTGGFGPPTAEGGVSALLLASREGAFDTVQVLLDGGALVNQQSAVGNTALLAAIQNGHIELAHLLLEHGADPSLANDKGWNPLYLAVKARTIEVGTMPNPEFSNDALYTLLTALLEKGANVNARLNANTEIRNAIRATWLEENGATPFLRAAMGGDLPVMKLLLDHGADPMIKTRDNTTALMAVAGVGFTNGFMEDFGGHEMSLEAMQLLLGLGLDVNAKNDDSTMALHGACHKNFVAAIQLLVDHGADLESRSYRRGTFERSEDFNGYTPLDWAQGVQTGGESALYNAEATELMERILVEKGIPIERNSNTRGGRVAQQ